MIKNDSGIVIKDELGATVCQMAYNGQGLGELKRKREAAEPHHLSGERTGRM